MRYHFLLILILSGSMIIKLPERSSRVPMMASTKILFSFFVDNSLGNLAITTPLWVPSGNRKIFENPKSPLRIIQPFSCAHLKIMMSFEPLRPISRTSKHSNPAFLNSSVIDQGKSSSTRNLIIPLP